MPLLSDFHNHSCLSPCGSLEMSPRLLASTAAARGVRLLALTDHNSSLNCPAFDSACKAAGIIPLFGMEACTLEEVHVLCLFGHLDAAMAFSEAWNRLLPVIPNVPAKMGDQVYVDEEDTIIGEVEYYLGVGADLGLDGIGTYVHGFGGLVIPAHVDRAAFSMTSQLGFIMKGPWAALECVRIPPATDTLGYPLTTSSDAHHPEHIARRPFLLETESDELLPNGPDSASGIDMKALAAALKRRPRG